MSINVAIVEDDVVSAEKIREFVQRYSDENNESIKADLFNDGDEIASDYKAIYKIIFLDIQMKRMDGMSAAEYIRKLDKDVIIVFITNMAQFAIKGYSVDALDFLLKPVSYFVFSQQMKRSIDLLRKREACNILFPAKNGVLNIDISQILYIASFSHKMVAYSKDEEYDFNGTMWQLENQLLPNNFYRCNNSYLINMTHVSSVNGHEVTVGKHKIPISRSRKKQFMEALTRFFGGMNRGGC